MLWTSSSFQEPQREQRVGGHRGATSQGWEVRSWRGNCATMLTLLCLWAPSWCPILLQMEKLSPREGLPGAVGRASGLGLQATPKAGLLEVSSAPWTQRLAEPLLCAGVPGYGKQREGDRHAGRTGAGAGGAFRKGMQEVTGTGELAEATSGLRRERAVGGAGCWRLPAVCLGVRVGFWHPNRFFWSCWRQEPRGGTSLGS